MAKNIVLCMDGTGNEIGESNTNIAKLFQMLQKSEQQAIYYDSGVATGKIRRPIKLFQFVTGAGISVNIKQAYEFLIKNYQPEDQVFLFGFSRGAYTARSLMGLINCVGLLRFAEIDRINSAYRLYAGKAKKSKADLFRQNYSLDCHIHFVGVFDTVGSLLGNFFFKVFGMLLVVLIALAFPQNSYVLSILFCLFLFLCSPWVKKLNAFLGIHKFHDTKLGAGRTFAFHAVSIDEKRRSFKPSLWNDLNDSRIEQVWFAGTHKDIGGPSSTIITSNTTLLWMLKHALKKGLLINCELSNLKTDNTKALTPNKFPLNLFPVARRLKKHYKFHQSVAERIEHNPSYTSAQRIIKLRPKFVSDPD